jgi:hypothetical protein
VLEIDLDAHRGEALDVLIDRAQADRATAGSDTRASPERATSGPSARIDARIVLTSSYGASGQSMCAASSTRVPGSGVSP